MEKKIIKFDDTGIEEYKFYQNKRPFLINDIDINKIMKMKTIILNCFKKIIFYLISCSNFDEEYCDKEYINLFLEILKK